VQTFSFALSLLAGGLVLAQAPTTPTPAPHPRMHHPPAGNPDDMFEKRLTTHLGLNATQQNALHTALAESRVLRSGLGTQMRTLHGQMVAAIKAGNTDQIDALSAQISELHKQETSIHGKTIAKIYGSLTADQKAKAGANLEMLMGHMGFGGPGGPEAPGMRHHGPLGAQPATGTSTPQQQ
jgi:Spy/CpxP family protein refolding chaperone